MLVLARRVDERIVIGGDVVVTVLEIGRGQVRLGIEAPKDTRILRHELIVEVGAENQAAAAGTGSAEALGALLGAPPAAPEPRP